MNTYAKTTYKFEDYDMFDLMFGLVETLTTGSWTIVILREEYKHRNILFHKDIKKVPTGYTQMSNGLNVPNAHLHFVNVVCKQNKNRIFDVEHTVDNTVTSSKRITAKLFYNLFDQLIPKNYPPFMRVSAGFTDLKIDFLYTLQYIMNTHVTTTYKLNLYTGILPFNCTFETIMTGSWIVLCDKIDRSRSFKIFHSDLYNIPTGYTQMSNGLLLPTNHLWFMFTENSARESNIFNKVHTVDNRVSSENITPTIFYQLFDMLTVEYFPKYMRVSAPFADLKFDFLHPYSIQ